MRDKIIVAAIVLALAACATIGSDKGYTICNDMAPNVTCPDNTANVVIGM